MKLFIARHGETVENAKQLLSGRMESLLTPRGKEQARALGRRLARENLRRIFASDLIRARETTRLVLESLVCEAEFRSDIRECSFGVLEGKGRDLYEQAVAASGLPRELFRPQDGENYEDLRRRLQPFRAQLEELPVGESYAVIAHGTLNRALINLLLGGEFRRIPQDSCNLSILERDSSNNWNAVELNCTTHLFGL